MPQNRSAFVDSANAPLRIADSDIPTLKKETDIIIRNYAVAVNSNDPAQQAGFMVKTRPIVPGHDQAGEVYAVGTQVKNVKPGDRIIGHNWQFLTDSVNTQPNSKGEVVIVYGGSSAVGAAAIQLAANAGYRVFAVSSEKNFDLCRELGASEVFDRTSGSIADDTAAAVGNDKFKGCFNAIGIPSTFEVVGPIMRKLGGGFLANTKPPGPQEGFTARFAQGAGLPDEILGPIWGDFLGPALAQGRFKCLPKPRVIGTGLESLEKAFEEERNGSVNAEKIVVEL